MRDCCVATGAVMICRMLGTTICSLSSGCVAKVDLLDDGVGGDATCTFARFYNDNYFHTSATSYYVINCYADYAGGVRWMFGAVQNSMSVNTGENETIKENVSFSVHGVLDYVNT